MHVGLNLIYLVPGETGGMETYARELIPALLQERPGLRLTAFLNREAAEDSQRPLRDLMPTVTVPVRARERSQWVRGEQFLLPRLSARAGVDLVHSLGSTSPAWGRFRRVVTIQDVIYRIFPEAHSPIRSRAMSFLIPLSARRAHRIITPSESTRSDLLGLLHISPDKIDVIPLGLGAHRVTPSAEAGLRSRLALDGRRVALTASAKRPHKNLMRLLDAWTLLPNEARPVLVLPGYPTPHETQLRQHAARLNLERDTRFLGWVPPADLEGLYALASCFVFPSLYEGFGLPVLEAMARGVPVACSDRGSLAEVAGQAALLFDPESPPAIAHAVQTILGNPATASSLRAAGTEHAKRFTWGATARATLRSYELAVAVASSR